jgi:hypothetical protein
MAPSSSSILTWTLCKTGMVCGKVRAGRGLTSTGQQQETEYIECAQLVPMCLPPPTATPTPTFSHWSSLYTPTPLTPRYPQRTSLPCPCSSNCHLGSAVRPAARLSHTRRPQQKHVGFTPGGQNLKGTYCH